MLEHGNDEALLLLPQLELARVTPWRCPCGCASFNLVLEGKQPPAVTSPMHIVAEFIFGSDEKPSGIFIFEKAGVLAGLEVYGLVDDAPKSLPVSEVLRHFK